MMDRKRKKTVANGKNKKQKVIISKESFLKEIENLALYTYGDRYYREVETDIGPLDLDWR